MASEELDFALSCFATARKRYSNARPRWSTHGDFYHRLSDPWYVRQEIEKLNEIRKMSRLPIKSEIGTLNDDFKSTVLHLRNRHYKICDQMGVQPHKIEIANITPPVI